MHSVKRQESFFYALHKHKVIATRSVSSKAALNLQKGFISHKELLSYWF